MAIINTSETPTSTEQPTQQAQAQMNYSNITKNAAPTIQQLFSSIPSVNRLSAEGRDFVERLRKEVTDESSGIQIEMHTLTTPSETVYFTSGGFAVVLIFAEAVERVSDLPTSIFIPEAGKALKLKSPSLTVLNVVVVTKVDYARIPQWTSYIKNSLLCATRSDVQGMKFADMASSHWYLDTNTSAYADYIEKTSPHAVPARSDFGFTVNLRTKANDLMGANNKDQINHMAVAAITGYTDFVQSNPVNGQPHFLPMVHITDIVTHIPKEALLAILVPMATEIFIWGNHWKSPFNKLGPKNINIGNLIKDGTTGAIYSIDNPGHRDSFIATYCENPVLTMDITEGRARIPGIEKYAQPEAGRAIIDGFFNFLGDTQTDRSTISAPVDGIFHEFIGYVQTGQQLNDSRWCDFLNCVHRNPADFDNLTELLTRNIDPKLRMNKQREVEQNFDAQYVNYICALNGHHIIKMHAAIRNALNVTSNIMGQAGLINVAAYGATANSLYASGYNGGFGNNSTYNGFNSNYMNMYNNR